VSRPSAPDRFDELWEAYVRQAATVELGTAPLTDRVLYCMMTISTFSVCASAVDVCVCVCGGARVWCVCACVCGY
jgi:hypothetical protein